MAMPPENVTPSKNLQFPPIMNWIPDERDGFISWLCAEFSAANSIIDSLCQHLQAIGDHNEYESVIGSINQRRLSWSQFLVMQQFYPVEDVSYNLQMIAWRQQQKMGPQRYFNSDQNGKYGGRRSGPGFSKHHGGYRGADSMGRNGHYSNSNSGFYREEAKLESDVKALSVADENKDGSEKPSTIAKKAEDLEESATHSEIVNHNCNLASTDNSLSSEVKQEEKDKECPKSMAKTFVVQEIYEAKMVNVVEGLKLYDKMLNEKEVSQLVSLVNNLRNAGRRGLLQSGAYVGYKRPNRGHGREMIQLGLPIADTPPDDENIKDRKVEPIPSVLSDIIERLVSKQVVPVKPDTYIINFFNEGDHSQPHMFFPWFGRPVGILSLSECDFTFGRVIVSDHPGDFKGSLKLSITPGSVLLVEGKSADLAKYAINSTRKQRILITFIKSRPRNSVTGPNWGPPPSSRLPNHHIRHPTVPPKHYPLTLTNGVLPTPSHRAPNGAAQPIFIPTSSPLAPFPGGMQTGWPPLPRNQPPPQPRMPIPGTGVFLPPGSNQELVSQNPPEKSDNSNGNSNSAEEEEEEASNRTAAGESDGSNSKQSI